MTITYPTLDAHREKLSGQWFSDWPKDDMRMYLAAIGDAHYAPLDKNTVLSTPISKHLNLKRDTPLWMEFSEPLTSEFLPVPKNEAHEWDWASGGSKISALFYYWPAREYARHNRSYAARARWDLVLIDYNGLLRGMYSYYASPVNRWAIPCFQRCEQCTHQDHALPAGQMQEPCVTPCIRCNTFLNTWRNRFRQALTLVQKRTEHR